VSTETAAMFAEIDADGSGEVSFEEFRSLIQKEAWVYEMSASRARAGSVRSWLGCLLALRVIIGRRCMLCGHASWWL
jgi:hypothetical protein